MSISATNLINAAEGIAAKANHLYAKTCGEDGESDDSDVLLDVTAHFRRVSELLHEDEMDRVADVMFLYADRTLAFALRLSGTSIKTVAVDLADQVFTFVRALQQYAYERQEQS